MTNIVMLVHGRYRLTMQAIDSIRQNTKRGEYTLTIVYDWDSDFRVRNYLVGQADRNPKDTTLIQVHGSRHCLGALKNLGVSYSASNFDHGTGDDDWLCILDNDVYMFPGWLDQMRSGWGEDGKTPMCAILGGVRHPFHQVNADHGDWEETDAVAGYCHFMSWYAWERLGPYNTEGVGIGQSEDFAICMRAKKAMAGVGYQKPPVMAHTGITNSKGEPIAGADLIERVPGVLYL